ncbi:sugar transferase [Pseudobacter ginsenosidimutans]|uniref:Lipopolysaccharide/colanic/teichoic acid biosynthesis glycosyltransferase n=1 Tax=Pseudobacter ginsenosidimutans TaxID=661488 RepID=A0A4Q7MWR1_9BACT|nr:sugar transferase [Pseudobacter ginsenosidimutans]RZS72499.1 lipopolysaccharide/colanic/teichoic acid biosynthesis glycosyltransferase [Pseudobacter ginsenosidimutans]
MELTFLPGEKTARRIYKHYSINSSIAAEQPTASNTNNKLEFFYIGKKAANIDSLIRTFESGYAAESVSNARSMLKRLLHHSKNIFIPDVIILEISASTDFRELQQFLATDSLLKGVPVIAEVSGLTEEVIKRAKECPFIDEILVLNEQNRSSLIRKIGFLKKVKQQFLLDKSFSLEMSLHDHKDRPTVIKRSFDIIVSSTILLTVSPLLLLIMAAIRLESRGPIFYISKRAGRGYKIFDFFKFRTMEVGADKKVAAMSHLNQYDAAQEGPVFFKVDNDPRITRIGNLLRKTSLDELPQLLNVLKGDMSLVGNRPLPLYEAASLTTDEWAKRFMAPAGITGLWQVKKRGKKDMSVSERIALDCDYAERYSFLYDMWIMANTPAALMQSSNA